MRANASEKPVIGVDIGGTKVSAGLVNSRGEILANSRKPMAPRGSPEEGLRAVTHTIDQLMRDRRAKAARAIGISVPGWVEAARGLLLSATNIPCWRDFPLGREIRKRYGLRTCIANDANAAALAEATWGAGKGYGNVFYVTLGTGIGTGIVMRGRIYEGRTGAAGEGGHVTIDFRGPQCGCGKCGCIEAFASGTAIAKRAQQRLAENDAKDSPILAQADGKIEAVTSEMVSKAAAQGDNLARQVLAEAAERLQSIHGGEKFPSSKRNTVQSRRWSAQRRFVYPVRSLAGHFENPLPETNRARLPLGRRRAGIRADGQ